MPVLESTVTFTAKEVQEILYDHARKSLGDKPGSYTGMDVFIKDEKGVPEILEVDHVVVRMKLEARRS